MKYILTLILYQIFIFSIQGQTFQDFINRVCNVHISERTAVVDSFMNACHVFPIIEQDTVAHFIYRGISKSVTIPSDANNWNPKTFQMTKLSTTDVWYFTKTFEPDARLDYKFVLNDSSWILDPLNPLTVPSGFGVNSELRMPFYKTPPEILYYPNIPHGALKDTVIFSKILGNSRNIRIYVPPLYFTSTDSFPVILFHDGLEYLTLANANNVIDYLISKNEIEPIIAVFVPPVNRNAEYIGNQMTQFSSFIVSELMPYIDNNFRTKRSSTSRAVLGASNGGNISLWLAFNYPDIFGNAAAQSSNIISSISDGFNKTPKLPIKLYLDMGTYDIPVLIPLVRNFISILKSKEYSYIYQEYHMGHSWGTWRANIDDAIRYFFPSAL